MVRHNTHSRSVPQERLISLLQHYQSGRYIEAEKLAISITQEFPKHPFGWKALGAVLGATGRKPEALDANQTAVTLSPQDAEAHNNLGNAYRELGRLDEAEASYKKAITLKPDFIQAIKNRWLLLFSQKRFEEALAHPNIQLTIFGHEHYHLHDPEKKWLIVDYIKNKNYIILNINDKGYSFERVYV